jgi:hypothetical protein
LPLRGFRRSIVIAKTGVFPVRLSWPDRPGKQSHSEDFAAQRRKLCDNERHVPTNPAVPPRLSCEEPMTGKSPNPGQRKPFPWRSILYGILGLGLLVVANLVVYGLIIKKGLLPDLPFLATTTPMDTPAVQSIAPQAPLTGMSTIEPTWTFTPLAETPSLTETPPFAHIPFWALSPMPEPTPAFVICRYTLKPGLDDFLYSIYLKWHIHDNIPDKQDFYAKIHCAVLQSNLKCDFHPADPDTTMPGWILDLPGVLPDICLFHGGTPVP